MDSFKIIFIATVTGLVLGALFAILKLPIPAPSSFSGVSAIFGIYAGYKLMVLFLERV